MAAKVFSGNVVVDTSGVVEVTLKEATPTERTRISSIWIDANDSDAVLSVKLYVKVDGANYRQIVDYDYALGAGESINLLSIGGMFEADQDIKITLTPPGTGAGNKTIHYQIPYDDSIEKLQSVFNGTGQTDDVDLTARSLSLINDAGSALFLDGSNYGLISTGEVAGGYIYGKGETNAKGLIINGDGSGDAVDIGAGSTAIGLKIAGGSTSGDAVSISTTSGHTVKASAAGANKIGLWIQSAGRGVEISGGTDAVFISGTEKGLQIQGATEEGLYIESGGADGAKIFSSSGGNGLVILGVDTNHGVHIKSGAGATGDALKLEALSTNGNAAHLTGKGTGIGLLLDSDTTGKGLKILQRTKSGDEDLMEIIWSKVAGKSTLGNTGGANEIEEKYYNYAEGAAIKTNTILKPDLTDNKDNLDISAMAGKEQ